MKLRSRRAESIYDVELRPRHLHVAAKLAGANGAWFGALFASTIAVATLAVLFAYARRQALRQRAG